MRRLWILTAVLVIECIALGMLTPYFWDAQNIFDRSRHFVEVGILALAMTFVILSAGIDLSVGSIMGFAGTVAGFSWFYGDVPLPLACLLALLAGTAAGWFNGWVVARFRIPPLLVTLAGLALYRGLAYSVAKEHTVSKFPAWFQWLGQAYIGIVPVQVIFFAVLLLATCWLFSKSLFGRYVTLIGENETAAVYTGVPCKKVTMALYAMSGLFAAVAGLILTARLNTAKPDAGEMYELDAITCVVLGGTKITGGKGSVIGTFLGLLILGMLRYGLELRGVPTVWVTFTVGCLLIATAVFNEKFDR